MKARIPGRQRRLNPESRPEIRKRLERVAALTLIEDFGFGARGEKLRSIEREVREELAEYDAKYPDLQKEIQAVADDAKAMGIDGYVRPGSGGKVLLGWEHDLYDITYLKALRRREKFGEERMTRFQSGMCKRIRYYNNVFAEEPGTMADVMQNRLHTYGKMV